MLNVIDLFFPNCRTVRIRCARSMPSCQPRLTITTASKPAKRRGQPDFLYFNQMPVSLIFTLTKKNVNRRRLAATDLVGWLFNSGAGSGGVSNNENDRTSIVSAFNSAAPDFRRSRICQFVRVGERQNWSWLPLKNLIDFDR